MHPNPRNEQIIAEFRAHGGTVVALSDGPPLLLLSTRGAKSAQPRIAPLRYLRDGDRWVVFAGNAGQPGLPAWYHIWPPTRTRPLPSARRPLRSQLSG